ncbi:hypothetical protein [Kurthia massiliensis]|uniref:hypothetical protein n=1 Tax=Kurthia massiliensis TaxID=1033739 RepID=UPI000287BB5C|nr:hypothetical protein [Kurthia massiliensis]
MKVISLSGASGTGKSTAALSYAFTHSIDALIDDGLLIVDGKRCAGTSAKFEKSALKAVRRAIFTDDAHRDEVVEAMNIERPSSLLIIGTSDKMTSKIAMRLGLTIDERIYIEDVASEAQIKLARFMRKHEGQHTMPLPMQQVEQNFFRRLIRRGMEIVSPKRDKIGETTIVLPDFHDDVVQISVKDMMDVLKEAIEAEETLAVKKMHLTLQPLPALDVQVVLKMMSLHVQKNPLEHAQRIIIDTFTKRYDLQFGQIRIKVVGVELVDA